MKKIIQITSISLLLFMSSCVPDDNTQPTPTEPRDKIIGTYSCNELENGKFESTFDIEIRKDSTSSTGILIDNFYNIGNQYTTKATFSANSIRIYQQNVSSFSFDGEGNFNGTTTISFTYKATIKGVVNSCTAKATKL